MKACGNWEAVEAVRDGGNPIPDDYETGDYGEEAPWSFEDVDYYEPIDHMEEDPLADALTLWKAELKAHGIEGKPDFSHMTEGLCRIYRLNLKADKAKLINLVKRFGDANGLERSSRQVRNWIGGDWNRNAAAMAIYGASDTLLHDSTLAKPIKARAQYGERELTPIARILNPWWPGYPDRELMEEASAYRAAFELCVLGGIGGGERPALLLDALLEVTRLNSGQLQTLAALLKQFDELLPFREDEPKETATEKVTRLWEELEEVEHWAIDADNARGDEPCISITDTPAASQTAIIAPA